MSRVWLGTGLVLYSVLTGIILTAQTAGKLLYGEVLAFDVPSASKTNAVYIMDVGHHISILIGQNYEHIQLLSWSSNGHYLMYNTTGLNFVYNYASGSLNSFEQCDRAVSAMWSPDNQFLAFLSEDTICLLNVETHNTFSYTVDGQLGERLTWSSNSAFIAFSAGSEHQTAVFILDVESEMVRSFTNSTIYASLPIWSPDGLTIAYQVWDGEQYDIYTQDLRTQELSNLTQSAAWEVNPVWSPDGEYLAFYSTSGIEILQLDSGIVYRPDVEIAMGVGANLVWSPNSQQLSILMIYDMAFSPALYLWTAETDRLQAISNSFGICIPSWSLDSHSLVYCQNEGGNGIRISAYDVQTNIATQIIQRWLGNVMPARMP